ncbi:speckle-type POZ protein-like [Aphidius gifuensis]|uniref:speckle-type POZ protein-like n=1 Tax=Aphidius gifuensis TaxID=684658 RepID=UPI001CDB8E7D|nr:speckle-type POZ protein-like [Aphidius gifuensis]
MDIGEEQNRATGEWHPEYYIWSIKEFGKKWSLCIRRRCGVFTSPIFQSGENSKYEWCLEFTPNSRLRLKLLNFDQHKNTEMNIKTCVSFINDEDETKNCSAFGELIVDENELIYSHALSTASAYKKKIFPVGKFKILIRIIPSSSEFELHDKEHLIDIMNSAVILDDKDSILSLPDPMIQLRSYKLHKTKINRPLLSGLLSCLQNEKFCDIVLEVDGKELKAHKMILSIKSPVFSAMFDHESMKESRDNRVVIEDMDADVVKQMLEYIYTGKTPSKIDDCVYDLIANFRDLESENANLAIECF